MWEYNYYDPNVLCHYGVPGMKWGRRKANPAVASARQNYKSAKRDLRDARREQNAHPGGTYKSLQKYAAARKASDRAELKTIDAKAKYKAAKSKNARIGQRQFVKSIILSRPCIKKNTPKNNLIKSKRKDTALPLRY